MLRSNIDRDYTSTVIHNNGHDPLVGVYPPCLESCRLPDSVVRYRLNSATLTYLNIRKGTSFL